MSPTEIAIECLHELLEKDVVENTFGVMMRLRNSLGLIEIAHDERLRDLLLRLSSESIREALHKGELHITNAIIESKNRILRAMRLQIPNGHEPIDVADYSNYSW